MAPSAVSLLTAPIRHILFDARINTPLLIAMLYYPERLRSILPASLHHLIQSPYLIRALKLAVSLSAVKKLNQKLSELVVNNWKSNAKFIKSQEFVLVTGGASGIGALMAELFAKAGVKVVVLDLSPPKGALPPNVYYYRGDVTNSSEIASVAAEIRKNHGEPTVLINNAGIGSGETILGGTEERMRKTFEVNTMAHFITAREFVPAMVKKNHGHVVTIASMASFVVVPRNVDYSCTKASALAFHEGLASELRSIYKAPNVRTTVVHPYWIRTPLTEKLIANPNFKEPVLEPEDVATAVVKQVMSGKSGQLILPDSLNGSSGIRGWPSWAQYGVRNRAGNQLASWDMDPNAKLI